MFPLTVGKQKMPKDKAKKIAEKYMELTQISDFANQKPGQLSGGQQQRSFDAVLTTDLPSNKISPLVGLRRPAKIFKISDFDFK